MLLLCRATYMADPAGGGRPPDGDGHEAEEDEAFIGLEEGDIMDGEVIDDLNEGDMSAWRWVGGLGGDGCKLHAPTDRQAGVQRAGRAICANTADRNRC